MHPPAYTFDETRLAALRSYEILDTPPEPGFDDLVELARQICEAPVALVSFVAADRQWFKARSGFKASETDLSRSVCAFALVEPDLLIIPDLTVDERTRANPLVAGDPRIRFYAGAPVRAADGAVLGSLSVIDVRARPAGLTAVQASALRNLGRKVSSQLELRRAVAERDRALAVARTHNLRREASDERYRTLFAAIDVGFCVVELRFEGGRPVDYRYIELNPAFANLTGLTDAEGQWMRALVPDLEQYWYDLYGDVALTGTPMRFEQFAKALGDRWYAVHAFRIGDPEQRRVAIIFNDVTDRKSAQFARDAAEKAQTVLNEELSHRMKNTFAMVLAIGTQTLRPIENQVPVAAFVQRIHALSTAHDILLAHGWLATGMADVVRTAVGAVAGLERFELTGPAVQLGPRATLSISLILHELTTNALKYGALSVAEGRVNLAWRLDGSDEEPNLAVAWRETGGPEVAKPARSGFGSRLIRMGLLGTGGADVRYSARGVEADFKAPLAQVQMP
jgi:PAS domain S-box-containing protein